MEVRNHDIKSLHSRFNRFIEELVKSQSSSSSLFKPADRLRLVSYLESLKAKVAWVVAQPELDLPETSPRVYALRANPEVPEIENEEVADIVELMVLAREELVHSQSASNSAGMIKFDEVRVMAIVTKVEEFLLNFVDTSTPLDLPESSPRAASTGAGRTGIQG